MANLRQLTFRYYPLTIVTPRGTLATAPLVTAAGLIDAILDDVEIQIPPGHSGLTGIALVYAGQQIFPWSAVASWLSADDYVQRFDIGMEVGPQLSVRTFNVGASDHTFFLRFKMHDLPASDLGAGSASASGGASIPNPVTVIQPTGVTDATQRPGVITTPVTVIIPPTNPLPGGPTVSTTNPALTAVSPNDPIIVAMQQSIADLQQTMLLMQSTIDDQTAKIADLTDRVVTLEAANPKSTATTATSTAPGANPVVVAQLAQQASSGTYTPLPIQTTPTGALIDPTTGRTVYSGPNGEGGYGTPQYAGQPSYTLPGGIVAYYDPGALVQNGNRAALGLPPLPNR